MKVNWDLIDSTEGFTPIPAGDYKARVGEIRSDRTTKHGDETWGVMWIIEEGKYAGRRIWDNLVFSAAGFPRVKLICARLGLQTTGEVDLEPDHFQDRRAIIHVDVEEYPSGSGKKRNVIPFGGFTAIDSKAAAAKATTTTKEAVAHNSGLVPTNEEDPTLPF